MYCIVIADDERIIREGISATLRGFFSTDAQILTAKDGKEALSLILDLAEKGNEPDVVITDIVMPETDGLELIRLCKEHGIESEFLILSSYDDFKFAQTAIKHGVDDYILKPCKPEELIRITKAALEKSDRQKHVKKQLPRAHQNLIHDFLHKLNTQQHTDQMYELKTHFPSLNGISDCNQDATFRIFAVAGCLADKSDAIKQIIHDTMEENFEEALCYTEAGSFFLITRDLKGRTADSICMILQQLLENGGIAPVTPIFISSSKSVENIPLLFAQLNSLMETKQYFTERLTVYADNVKSAPIDAETLTKETASNIVAAIHAKDESAVKKEIRLLGKAFEAALVPLKEAKDLCYHIQYAVCGDRHAELAQHLQQAATLEQLEEVFTSIIMDELSGTWISKYSPPIQTTIDYIQNHLAESGLSLQRLASEAAFMNSDYLGKLFKKETGLKFSDFLLEKRMEKAKQLLMETKLPVQQIAEQTGFAENPSYFCQLFKKTTGETPGHFRQH